MSPLLVIIIILVLLSGGGWFYGPENARGGFGGLGFVLIIVLVYLLLRGRL